MDRLFRIDFYPSDWLIDTAILEPLERGIYINIVMLIYAKRGPIDNNVKWLSGACNCSSRLIKTVINSLLEKGFIQLSGSKITQKRAESELKKKRTHLELSSKGGRNKSENESENNKINNLTSTDNKDSVPTPIAIAIATASNINSKDKSFSFIPPKQKIEYNSEEINFTGISEKQILAWKEAYPAIDIEEQIKKAAVWMDANPKHKKSNYSRFLTNWFTNSQDRSRPVGGKQGALSFQEQADLKFKKTMEEARKKYVEPS